ncbi:hypothetical protein [Paenibacillus pinihumi]|uniref:hypothetical protein n=1 Tax=Paenibacillus pinihumi TaxID=669462 RepID=UPI00048B24CC|nr:hypothetical protein [Paenibacillus pinihumi]
MEYSIDLEVFLENGGKKDHHVFTGEKLIISRSSQLWIQNKNDRESDFIETVKVWDKLDRSTGKPTFYQFKTSEMTPIGSKTTYRLKRIVEKDQAVVFEAI